MRKMITVTTSAIIASRGRASKAPRLLAIHSASPDAPMTPASETAAEQQQHAPRRLVGLFPIHQKHPFVQVNWNQEQCDRCGHGNAGVVHAVDIVGQQWLEDPGRRCQHEHHGDHFSARDIGPRAAIYFEQATAVAPRGENRRG